MESKTEATRDFSYFQSAGAFLLAVKEGASVPEQFPYGLGVLLLNFFLFQTELVPRWLSVWGLIAGVLIVAMGALRLFGRPMFYLAIPIVLNEIVLAIWLIVVGFDSAATTSTVVGVLFITALASSILNGVFIKSIDEPDYPTNLSADENKVSIGVLFQLALTASVVAIPIFMFPVIREHNEILALGYLSARIFEGFFDAVIAISQVLLLTLSREFAKAGIRTANADNLE